MFRVGQKVVCIRDGRELGWDGGIVKGCVYTVSSLFSRNGVDAIALVEVGPNVPGFSREGYRASVFRPVVERKTDISVFQKLLQPKPERVE